MQTSFQEDTFYSILYQVCQKLPLLTGYDLLYCILDGFCSFYSNLWLKSTITVYIRGSQANNRAKFSAATISNSLRTGIAQRGHRNIEMKELDREIEDPRRFYSYFFSYIYFSIQKHNLILERNCYKHSINTTVHHP